MKTPILIECPRDAMQGIKNWIPTEAKIMYIQSLLSVGFDVLDVGSFVSPKAIPQMKDTAVVIENIDFSESKSELLVIVANLRGAFEAVKYDAITYIGFPLSVSENFQMRNTHKTQQEALFLLDQLIEVCNNSGKKLVLYLSMGFGNPYGDPWSVKIVTNWIDLLAQKGIQIISLSDTVGSAKTNDISEIFKAAINQYSEIEIGAHFHTQPEKAFSKIKAAHEAGCNRFDGAIKGFGGCPMAADNLTGNMPSEKLISYFNQQKIPLNIDPIKFEYAYNQSLTIFI
ncbi:MAG: hydroxymethylglutaryl-CoA lyase [Flavobacteriaceae bacterium]|jgi:hydroxymethylglutaryl-CoA lyase|nr:hydroxymethylglutaryl-CoA lyase [Flavobacteriaceae bacterium]MDO7581861.1 hydroxymethylglutaryl-CoA lyase [Flavobacteriaceae bacterium]MDO7603184.1 hydroxymethylglutaryl-CoA lyase [Flavobacteriaceae bacterium]MDO7703516.1 hydroxymethylglutaryl-CoA lyase [Flavobacteriaceae bacterium]